MRKEPTHEELLTKSAALEEDLAEIQDRLHVIYQHAPFGVASARPDGTQIMVNPKYLEMVFCSVS